jgi:5-methylcytosine-specific restriction enzyme A
MTGVDSSTYATVGNGDLSGLGYDYVTMSLGDGTVPNTVRRKLSKKDRLFIFALYGGRCCICGGTVDCLKPWVVEHVVPLSMGGLDVVLNMMPAHEACAKEKTRAEADPRAKADRRRAKHLGIKKQQKRPMPGTKASEWKKRMDGTVERRK